MAEAVYFISEKIPGVWILFGIAVYFLFYYPLVKNVNDIALKTKGTGIPVRTVITSLQLLLIFAGFAFSIYAIKQASFAGGDAVNSVDHILYAFIAVIYVLFGLSLGGLGMLIYRMVKSRHGKRQSDVNDEQDISISLKDIKSAIKQKDNMKKIQASLDEYFNEGKYDKRTKKVRDDKEN